MPRTEVRLDFLAEIPHGAISSNSRQIMNEINLIPYDRVNVMETLQNETTRALGADTWNRITDGIETPRDDTEPSRISGVMRAFMARYNQAVDSSAAADVLCRVAHGLKVSDFTWAREAFEAYGDIDAFCAAMHAETIAAFERAMARGETYLGTQVDEAVLRFVKNHATLLYGARRGRTIVSTAIPFKLQQHIQETDPLQKRYLACHCHFARQSILQPEGPVSRTLCQCSLGHTKVFWEAALDMPLTGTVRMSALGGDPLCQFHIRLPEEAMARYVR